MGTGGGKLIAAKGLGLAGGRENQILPHHRLSAEVPGKMARVESRSDSTGATVSMAVRSPFPWLGRPATRGQWGLFVSGSDNQITGTSFWVSSLDSGAGIANMAVNSNRVGAESEA